MNNRAGKPWPSKTLTATLALTFFALSAIAILISAGAQLFFSLQMQHKLIASNQQLIAQDAARTVSGFLQEKIGALEAVIGLTALDELSRARQKEVLTSLFGEPAFRHLGLLDTQGEFLTGVSRLTEGEYRRFLDRIPDIKGLGPQEKRAISEVYIDDETSEPMVLMSVPMMDIFGTLKGTLLAEVRLRFMWDLVYRLQVGQSGYAYVVNKRGDLIASGDMARVLRAENVAHLDAVDRFIRDRSVSPTSRGSVYRGLNGAMVVGTYVPLGMPDWAVITELPWTEAHRELMHEGVRAIGIALIVATLASLLGIYLARHLATPLANLTAVASRIAGGETHMRALVQGPKEVARLAAAFNSMTAQLGQTLEGLEQQIAERTRAENEVRRVNEHLEQRVEERTQELQEALTFRQEIMRASSVGITVYDSKGQCILANENSAKMVNASLEQVLAQNYHRIESWRKSGLYAAALAAVESGQAQRRDIHVMTTFGKEVWLECRLTPFRPADQPLLLLTANDISDRIRADTEIRQLNHQLQAQADDLARANGELSRTLQDLQHAQSELVRSEKLAALGSLVAGIAHELNTPLGNALLAATSVQDLLSRARADGRSSAGDSSFEGLIEHVNSGLDIAVQNLHSAANLVTHFKQVAVDQTSSQRRIFDLRAFVDEILLTLHPTLRVTPFKVAVEIPEGINLDSFPGPLGQVLVNLVNNAVVHGLHDRPSGTITVSAERAEDSRVRVTIVDDGHGIDQSLLGKIFDPFVTSRMGSGGTGLGLHLVHNAVTNILGGSIDVRSRKGEGTRFEILLPECAPHVSPQTESAHAGITGTQESERHESRTKDQASDSETQGAVGHRELESPDEDPGSEQT